MRKLLSIIVTAGIILWVIPINARDDASQTNPEVDFEWKKAFGQAVLDWSIESDTNTITIEVDWSSATWGLGAEISLKEPINLKEVAEIEALVYTIHNSPTKVYLMVSTPDDANLSFPSRLAYPVTSVENKFTFPVDKLVSYKPDTTSKDFQDDDWKRVDRIKFILTKPTDYAQGRESIIISNPRIVYSETAVSGTPNEVLEINKSVESSGVAQSPDVEYGLEQDYEKAEINDVSKQPEMTHFQSLEELIDQYPSDDSSRVKTISRNNAASQKLVFDEVRIYEDCIQDWGSMDNENKFIFDVTWKNDQSGFTMHFNVENSIESSGEWHLVFTARVLDRSKPQINITAYGENDYDKILFSYKDINLKNRWKTFHVPLIQKVAKNGRSGSGLINRINIMCLNTNTSSVEEDVVIIKDLQLIKK